MLETKPVQVSEPQVVAVLQGFCGSIEQLPPMHSALKRGGVPLYKLARRGESVERAPRRVQILELEKIAWQPPLLEIRVRCSKGTYIRTLAEDLGKALGTVAHLSWLRRTASGSFHVRDDGSVIGLARADAHGALRPLRLTATTRPIIS